MIIAQLSDTHIISVDSQDQNHLNKRVRDLKLCVRDINILKPIPDAVIHTGDMTQTGNLSEYKITFDILNHLKVPFFVVPGNRDSRAAMRKIFFPKSYSWELKDTPMLYEINQFKVRLIGLDSLSSDDGLGSFCKDRIAQLDRMLKEKPNLPTAIFMHHPPIPIELFGTIRHEFSDKASALELLSLINLHKQIFRVFCGHSHRYYRKIYQETEFTTVPSVATDLRAGEYPKTMSERPIYQVHRYSSPHCFTSETRLVGTDS